MANCSSLYSWRFCKTKCWHADLVETNLRDVHHATSGRVGYIHVPDTCQLGFSEFYRYFGPQCNKEALIVDLRCNAGGYASELFLKHLRTLPIGWNIPRTGRGQMTVCPQLCTSGRFVMLVDENTCSDGECWADAFQHLGLGKVVGVQTWGGVVEVGNADLELVDGSVVSLPCDHFFLLGGTGYNLENRGVLPDVVVEWPPDTPAGHDPQLAAAIAEALKLIQTASPKPTIPPFPRTRLHRTRLSGNA